MEVPRPGGLGWQREVNLDISGAGLVMALALQPVTLGRQGWQDLALELRFTQQAQAAVTIYPDAAQLAQRSGWGGPTFEVRLVPEAGGPAVPLVELRTWYGPPGQPPTAAYFAPHRRKVKPGRTEQHVLRACWLPGGTLLPGQLEARVLDPQGMDGLEASWLGGASVLVLGRRCAELEPRRRAPDLLRGHVIALVPTGGRYGVSVVYAQQQWGAFKPTNPLRLQSAPVSLTFE
jgi:hypothetical protein